MIGAVVDITERKRHEVELRESERRFRTFFDSVTDAIFVLDVALGNFSNAAHRKPHCGATEITRVSNSVNDATVTRC